MQIARLSLTVLLTASGAALFGPELIPAAIFSAVPAGASQWLGRRGQMAAACILAVCLGYFLTPVIMAWGNFSAALMQGVALEAPAVVLWSVLSARCCQNFLDSGKGTLSFLFLSLLPGFLTVRQGGSPAPWAGAAYILALGAVWIPGQTSLHSPRQYLGLTGCTAGILVVILGLGMSLGWPEGTALRGRVLEAGEKGLFAVNGFGTEVPLSLPDMGKISLSNPVDAGDNRLILTLTAQKGGTYYLRGRDYDTYTGTQWISTPSRREDFSGWGEAVDSVTVSIESYSGYLLLPYYPKPGTELRGGSLNLTLRDYTLDIYPEGSAVAGIDLAAYTALPEETRIWALSYLGTVPKTAPAIASLVSAACPYDTGAKPGPEDDEDFAQWFLTKGISGYCTHFATAAVVLLRAAGIPARYVTGIMVEAEAGVPTAVTAQSLHAWAEFYDVYTGRWEPLEATPPKLPQTENGMPEKHAAIVLPAVEGKYVFLLVILLVAVIYLQSRLRVWLRHFALCHGSWGSRCLAGLAEAKCLAGLLGEEPPLSLERLTQKALYSQYSLCELDMEPFRVYRRQCLRRLKRKPLRKRLHYRIGCAAY